MSLALVTLFATGCAMEVSFKDSHYACDTLGDCPTGYTCSRQGFCEADPASPDAAQVADGAGVDDDARRPDARVDDEEIDAASPPPPGPDADLPPPPPIDAAVPPPPPDAALPDAGVPPTTMTFGASRDTQLYSPEPNLNFGNWAEIQCAVRTSPTPFVDSPVLFGFNTAAIPQGATVQSATLRLTVSGNALGSGKVNLYALREDWTEGFQDGTPGVANYNERRSGQPWSSPGAKPPSRGTSVLASFSANQTFASVDVPLPASLVQGWVEDPGSNHGVILTCPENQDVTFFTRGGGTASQRPRLTVSFVP